MKKLLSIGLIGVLLILLGVTTLNVMGHIILKIRQLPVALVLIQAIYMLSIYRYIINNYILGSIIERPLIFNSDFVGMGAIFFSFLVFTGNIIMAFILTSKGWPFLVYSVVIFLVANSLLDKSKKFYE